jgi:hypothetical protein
MPYVERSQDWGPAPSEPVADRLDLDATNIRSATVAGTRARLSCSPKLNIKTDGPLNLTIDCSKSGATRLPRVQAVAVSGAKRRAFTVRVNVVRTSKRGKTRTVSLVRSVRAAG